MSLRLDALNPQQREAVTTIEGPLLLLAGAGTGKTRVITCRAAYLVEQGIPPASVLAVTFTNKAAREMSDRLAELLSRDQARLLTASTFHAFCARVLRRHIRLLGYSPGFAIAPGGYQVGLVKTILGETGLVNGPLGADGYLASISRAKSLLLHPDEIPETAAWPPALGRVYSLYQTRMRNMDQLDFDDLLMLVVDLWTRHPEVLAAHRDQYRFLEIDEYQDTNAAQLRLMTLLAGEAANLCAVGDDDQSIYGWRGADVSNILHFADHFPRARIIRLEQNYRSTNTILSVANQVIANNPDRHDKRLWSQRGQGEPVLVVCAQTDEAEAGFVADVIAERMRTHKRSYADFAILYRSNSQSRLFEERFRRLRIPYRIVGGRSFYERREILDAISFLLLAANPKDDLSLLRVIDVPPRGVGDKSIERLRELQLVTGQPAQTLIADAGFLGELPAAAAEGLRHLHGAVERFRQAAAGPGTLAAAVETYLREVGYLDGLGRMYKPREDALARLENVHEFLSSVAEYAGNPPPGGATLAGFLEAVTLQDDSDRKEDAGDGRPSVTLMTVHAAKGLEFPVVILVGVEQGMFPHRMALAERSLEEERRLFYVALTRAQEEVIITHAARRRVAGVPSVRRPSVFVEELPVELTERSGAETALKPLTREEEDRLFAEMRKQFSV
ncbi:MAG: ATP-dependent DNA helicase PcrA [Lentisphaerae bacterium ADurb.BinA184]|nr:MAG: ATP-dependent DNA helicase PcrA [Lentisphaerae bacterium ADurb.BinA184]